MISVSDHRKPIAFGDYFELGLHEKSPFLTPESQSWGKNLTLRASILAAFFLMLAFGLSFHATLVPLAHMLLVLVYFLAGIPALIEATEDLALFDINIDILMTVAAFSSFLIGSGMEGGLLLVLFALSGSMEDAVTAKARSAINSLNKISPNRACVIDPEGLMIERALIDVKVGDKILVRSGQIVPLDGVVISGASSVNLVHLTGENLPVPKKVDDEVPAGARNLDGVLTILVSRTSADSTLAKIIELVTEAQEARPKLQRWFDSLSRTYAVSIILLSLTFALSFPYLFSISFFGLEGSIYRALSFLIAASPCALIIAIPIAYLSAVSACARKGILIKGGASLDALSSCRMVAFDKTGTLTTGELSCISLEPLFKEQQIPPSLALSVAASLEQNAIHPIAKAILKLAKAQSLELKTLDHFRSIPGSGLEGTMLIQQTATQVAIGQPDFIASKLPSSQAKFLLAQAAQLKDSGKLVATLLVGQECFLMVFQDTIRPEAKNTVLALKKQKLKMAMLTGDHEKSARAIANFLDLDEVYAELKPEDKLQIVTKLSENQNLAMIGDGVNDAPALARATAGICMGKVGSTTAIDAADIVLLHDNIEYLDWLFKKASQTTSIVKQNLFIAVGAIVVASLPALAGLIPLWLAVVLHEGGTVLVGLNALRLLRN